MLTPAYAILVGSNAPGPGQQPLQYAGQDARRVAEVLVELGDFAPENVRLLDDPSAAELLAALDAVEGERSTVVFYYSGHARARSLVLGDDELPVDQLRARLEATGATFTLVVLDACQAGAPGVAKGVELVPDFSSQSVAGLHTQGVVVLASSTADELSQESPTLRGSPFTHHLVSGLRGAADQQGDGLVTLDEAYAYAYHRTLVDTAPTALGAQHPTLEMDVTGYGGTVLTRPGGASAQLVVPASLAADLLLERVDVGVVAAEVHKAAGSEMVLALAPGAYQATMRTGRHVEQCDFAVDADASVDLSALDCRSVRTVDATAKGGDGGHRTVFEAGVGALYNGASDPFLERLEAFGYGPGRLGSDRASDPVAQITAGRALGRTFSVHGTLGTLDARAFYRENLDGYGDIHQVAYRWTTTRLTASARATWTRQALGLYAQIGVGPAWSKERYEEVPTTRFAPHLAGGLGMNVMPGRRRHGLGFYGQFEFVWAPTLKNLLDDVHDTGGPTWQLGLRLVP